MTLKDILQIIDQLSPDERAQVKAHIEKQQQAVAPRPQLSPDLQSELDAALADAQPVTLQAGTMDVDKLKAAVAAMRKGFTQSELDAIADAMDGNVW